LNEVATTFDRGVRLILCAGDVSKKLSLATSGNGITIGEAGKEGLSERRE
jgi:hypothetical protein